MNLAVATGAWIAACGMVFAPPFRDVRTPLLVFLLAYGATTVIGAAFMLDAAGQAELLKLHANFDQKRLLSIPPVYYWTFLLMPLALVPVGALIGARIGSAVVSGRIRSLTLQAEAARWALFLLLGALAFYCFYKLAVIGAALPAIIDSSLCFNERIERRTELIGLLGNPFYAVIYSALPITGSVFLADYLQSKERLSLIGFVTCVIVLLWFYSTTFMKYPFIMLAVLVLLTLYFSGIGIIRATLMVVPVAAVAFVLLSAIEVCTPVYDKPPPVQMTEPSQLPHAVPGADARPKEPDRVEVTPPLENLVPSGQVSSILGHFSYLAGAVDLMQRIARNLIFRMAIGFPYYLTIFSDEKEYCGTSSRYLPFGPREVQCEAEIKVFHALYPNITHVVGYQPAPVHLMSLAQGGPVFAVLATLMVGLAIGCFSAAVTAGRTPLLIAASVATCIYAYYATQSSLRGAVLHGYGLLWCMLPLAGIFLVSILTRLVRRPPPASG